MLACIACSAKEGGEDGSRAAATPAVRSLTSQVRTIRVSPTTTVPRCVPLYWTECTTVFFKDTPASTSSSLCLSLCILYSVYAMLVLSRLSAWVGDQRIEGSIEGCS